MRSTFARLLRSPLAALALSLVPSAGLSGCDGNTAPNAAPPDRPAPEADPSGTPTTPHRPAEPEPEPEPEPAPAYDHADTDPDNDAVIGVYPPLEDCAAQLEALGVRFKDARIGVGRKRDGVYTCGSKQVVRFQRGPGKIRYSSSPLLTCPMAIAMADFERVVQDTAQEHLGTRVVRIEHLGTYNCRDMANFDMISEHSYANAIDLRRFVLADGRTVDVLEHFKPGEPDPSDPRTRFLRDLGHRLYDEHVFSNVITPFFDRLHRNHIHVDLARYRVDGSRP